MWKMRCMLAKSVLERKWVACTVLGKRAGTSIEDPGKSGRRAEGLRRYLPAASGGSDTAAEMP